MFYAGPKFESEQSRVDYDAFPSIVIIHNTEICFVWYCEFPDSMGMPQWVIQTWEYSKTKIV